MNRQRLTGRAALRAALVLTALSAAVLAASCDSFYSTSWGKPREYKASNIKVTADNVDSWVEAAAGNPELAAAISKAIKDKLKGMTQGAPTAEQLKLQEAGTKIAVEEAGLGTTILGKAGSLLDKLENIGNTPQNGPDNVTGILLEIRDELEKNSAKAAADISGIVGGSLNAAPGSYQTTGGTPEFCQDYAETAQPSDVGQTILILAMTVFNKNTIEDLQSLDLTEEGLNDKVKLEINQGSSKVDVLQNAKPEAVTLAAYLNMISADKTGKFDNNPITSGIKSAFGL